MEDDGICLQPVEFKVKNFGVDSVPVDYDLQLSSGAPSTGAELVCQGTSGVLDPGDTEMINGCEVLYTGQGTVTLTLNTSPAYGIDSDLTNNSLQTRIVVVQ